MNIAVVGYATEGVVSAAYFAAQGHAVTVCDKNPNTVVPPAFSRQLGDNYLEGLDRFDLIVRSAGIHPAVLLAHNPDVEPKITTAINEFFAHAPTKNVIGITGTKGKGTTSTLTTRILEAHGHKTWLGGNIGRSPLEFIDEVQPDDWVILELSSFQLYDVKYSPHIAACLMVVPEHLDWHKDLDDYQQAKANLFRWQNRDDVAVYYDGSSAARAITGSSPAVSVPYFADPGATVTETSQIEIAGMPICHTSELQLLGEHNWQNVCAAITIAWYAGCKDVAKIKHAVTTFTGLPHRLEFVRELDGVRYYDDSFGTTPETAIVALQAFPEPKVIILGGSDKGASYEQLAVTVANQNVRHIVLIGDTAPAIRTALDTAGYSGGITTGLQKMPDMVTACRQQAVTGDIVLLSTGCASFGLFKNYKDRAAQFSEAVQALPPTAGR